MNTSCTLHCIKSTMLTLCALVISNLLLSQFTISCHYIITSLNNMQKTGPASTLISNSTKRILPSISPSQNDKKTKVYVSPNHFALLANYDINNIATTIPLTNLKDNSVNLLHTGLDIGFPAPPIHIKKISNYSAFNKVLTNITDPNGFTCRSTLSNIIVQPAGHQHFNKIIDYLPETNVSLHSYTFPPLSP